MFHFDHVIRLLLPVLPSLTLQQIEHTTTTITLSLQTTRRAALCPSCQCRTTRVHSMYERTLGDLPWATYAVRLRVRVCRFRCSNTGCPRRTFVEPLDPLALRRARRTARLVAQLTLLGQQVGGEAGSRLAQRLKSPASPALLVQLVRHAPLPAHPTPRVLGIDDFAFKRGHTYGTLLCDLERDCVIDLLPDRTTATVAAWLQHHPGVTIISRDRAGAYAEAGRQGAPDAQQVADRFHLLKNLTETVERLLERCHAHLPTTTRQPPECAASTPAEEQAAERAAGRPSPARRLTPAQQRRQERAATVRRYAAQGWSLSAIARHLHLDRKTVRGFIRATHLPMGTERRRGPSILEPYHAYLHQRWTAGSQNAQQLYREIQQQGYRGGATIVRAFLRQHQHRSDQASSAQHAPARRLTPRAGAWLLVALPEHLTTEQHATRDLLRQAHPELEHAYTLAQGFGTLVRQRQASGLSTWLAEADHSGIAEFRSFARGLQRDLSAVRAALTVEVSNGPTEGHITRLKCIKRMMYGRANLDLLRARVLATT